MKCAKQILLSFSFLVLILVAKANEPGDDFAGKSEPVLHGNITDATTKKPVAGVLISICGSRILEKFTTDASGNFKISQMPSGEVTIILEKKGYKTFRRERVLIKEGLSLKLDLDLKSQARNEDSDYFHPLMLMMEGN